MHSQLTQQPHQGVGLGSLAQFQWFSLESEKDDSYFLNFEFQIFKFRIFFKF